MHYLLYSREQPPFPFVNCPLKHFSSLLFSIVNSHFLHSVFVLQSTFSFLLLFLSPFYPSRTLSWIPPTLPLLGILLSPPCVGVPPFACTPPSLHDQCSNTLPTGLLRTHKMTTNQPINHSIHTEASVPSDLPSPLLLQWTEERRMGASCRPSSCLVSFFVVQPIYYMYVYIILNR